MIEKQLVTLYNHIIHGCNIFAIVAHMVFFFNKKQKLQCNLCIFIQDTLHMQYKGLCLTKSKVYAVQKAHIVTYRVRSLHLFSHEMQIFSLHVTRYVILFL